MKSSDLKFAAIVLTRVLDGRFICREISLSDKTESELLNTRGSIEEEIGGDLPAAWHLKQRATRRWLKRFVHRDGAKS